MRITKRPLVRRWLPLVLVLVMGALHMALSYGNVYTHMKDLYFPDFRLKSLYLDRPDGVKLALDVFLPPKDSVRGPLPTILYQTRYIRRLQPYAPLAPLAGVRTTVYIEEIKHLVANGYAVVVADVRGAGASTGFRKEEFGPAEREDSRALADWIVAQDWSNGRIGLAGGSYLAIASLMTMRHNHPAIQAVVLRSAIYDMYEEVSFPGGIRAGRFLTDWNQIVRDMDQNRFRSFGTMAEKGLRGIHPVDSDTNAVLLHQALAQRQHNIYYDEDSRAVQFRDTVHPVTGFTPDKTSPAQYMHEINRRPVPVLAMAGWQDGGCIRSATRLFRDYAGPLYLHIGPWDHSLKNDVDPFQPEPLPRSADVPELMVQFFDQYLKPGGKPQQRPLVHYCVQGSCQWKDAPAWPLPGARTDTLWLAADSALAAVPGNAKPVAYQVDTTVGSGLWSRWNFFTNVPAVASQPFDTRTASQKPMLHYTGPAAVAATEYTGTPWVRLQLASSSSQAHVHVYLQDVAPDGRVVTLTEGMLDARHRKLCSPTQAARTEGPCHTYLKADMQPIVPGQAMTLEIALLPTSFALQPGHRLRLAIAGADADYFDHAPGPPPVFTLHSGGALFLPAVAGFLPEQLQ